MRKLGDAASSRRLLHNGLGSQKLDVLRCFVQKLSHIHALPGSTGSLGSFSGLSSKPVRIVCVMFAQRDQKLCTLTPFASGRFSKPVGTFFVRGVLRLGELRPTTNVGNKTEKTMKKTRLLCLAILAPCISLASADHYVYTLLNQPSGNAVQTYVQGSNGKLKLVGKTSTGGLGTGQGLGSQGALAMSASGRYLFAVNAGDSTVSLFAVTNGELTLLDVEKSEGESPVSVTESDGLVYVLNQGTATTPGGIQGFANFLGELIPIPRATASVSGVGVIPVEVKFTPNGGGLVVAEKVSNLIDTFQLDVRCLPRDYSYQNSYGKTPFGFDFDKKGRLFVTEAAGGASDASTVTSYSLGKNLGLTPITKSAPTNQTAACWDVVSPNGEYLYTGNAGSGNVSGFRIGANGTITLLEHSGVTGTTGGKTLDTAMSPDGEYLYVLSAINQQITTYRVAGNGSLTLIDTASGLPTGTSGLVVH